MENPTDKKRTNLLTFKIDLNREGNLEFDLTSVQPAELEKVLVKTGDIAYAHRIGDLVRDYSKEISAKVRFTNG